MLPHFCPRALGGFDGSLKGIGSCWEGWVWGLPVGWEDTGAGLSPCSVVSPSPFTLQMRSKKHKVKMLCQIQADRTSAPKATTSLCAAPCLPNPPLGPPSGLSLQGGAIQTWERGSCRRHPHPPGWGPGWTGSGQLQQDSRPGSPRLGPSITPWCPSRLRGGKMRRGTEISQCIQSLQAAGGEM